MRQLVNVNNVDVPSSDYPKGRVRDKVGSTLGTEYSEILHGDIIQFFQKLIIDGSITENDLPDNVSNGYQLLQALNLKIKETSKASTVVDLDFVGVFSAGVYNISSESYDRMMYVSSGGTVSADYELFCEFSGEQIGRINEYASVSFLLPANTPAIVEHQSGTGSLTVRSQKIGI